MKPGASADVLAPLRRAVLVTLGMLVLLGLVLVGLWRTDVGHTALVDLATRADPLGLAGALVLMMAALPCMALRWRALLPGAADGRRPGVGVLTLAILISQLFNYALPGPVGDVAAAAIAGRRYGLRVLDALTAMVVARFVGLGTACLLAGIALLIAPLPVPVEVGRAVWIAAAVLGLGACTVLLAALFPEVPGGVVVPLARRLEGAVSLPGRLARRVVGFVAQVIEALVRTSARGPLAWAASVGWSIAGHLAVASGIAVAAWSLGATPAWSGVLFTYAMSTAGAVVLFLLPGTSVGWDISFGTLLAVTTRVSPTDAAAVTVVARVQQILAMLAGAGVVSWFARDLLPAGSSVDEPAGVVGPGAAEDPPLGVVDGDQLLELDDPGPVGDRDL